MLYATRENAEPDHLWLVDGGVCGVAELEDVGTRLEDPSTLDFPWFVGGEGTVLLPEEDTETGTPGLTVLMW